jgi:L-2-hydroxyglutarate oxidase LhgO
MADFGVAVVGAGAVGLAVAARLSADGRDEVVVLERRERHGQETSSRNSEVIHAGLYYPTGSLKARLCVEGRERLYERCRRLGLPHRGLGKLIVATAEDERPALEALLERGRANGVPLELLSAAQVSALEPAVPSVGGLLSPTTGIVGAHPLMDSLLHEARANGALLQTRAELVALEHGSEWRLTVRNPDGLESFTAERVVNAAGLESDRVAALAGIDVAAAGYELHWCKGSYFSVAPAKAGLVSRLVYPVPGHVSLGVHAVIGLDARLRFGPDVEYLPGRKLDYAVPDAERARFAESARRLLPALQDEDLSPDISGIRAKLQGPGQGFRDFVVAEESSRGLPGLVNLVGIDSPGLTSCLALAEEVARLL